MKKSDGKFDYVEAIAKLEECKARWTLLWSAIEYKNSGNSFGISSQSGGGYDSDTFSRLKFRRASEEVEYKEHKVTNCLNALIKQVSDDLNSSDPKFVTHNYEYLADTHSLPMFMSDLVKYIVRRKPRIVWKSADK